MNLWQFYKDNPSLLETKVGDELAQVAAIVVGTSTKNAFNVFVDGGSVTSSPSGTQDVNVIGSITIPVSGPLTNAELRAMEVAISAVSLPLPAGAATEAKQTQPGVDIGDVTVNNGSGVGAVNVQDGGNSITVDGTVSVDNFPASQAVTGPLTDAELRATPVPISGTVTATPTGTQDVNVVGTITLPISAASLPLPTNAAQETGGNLASLNAKDFATQTTLAAIKAKTDNLDVLLSTRTKPADTQLVDGSATTQPISAVSLPLPTGASTEATLSTRLADATFTGRINTFGQKAMAASTPVVIASDQTTIPISAASLPLPSGAATAALQTQPGVDIGDVTINNASGAGAVNIQDGGNSITVDGTVTANQGTANTVANGWPIKVTDGTNTMPTGDVASRAIFHKVTDGTDTMGVNTDGSIVNQPSFEYYVGQGQVFSLSGTFTAATGGAFNPIFLIKNPNASGKTFRIRRLYVGCTVTNVQVDYAIYYAPTITANGTSQTPHNNSIGSGTASVSTAFSLPTLSSIGTQIFAVSAGQNTASPETNPVIDVQANQNVVVAANPASNNRAVTITVIWAEV